MDDLEMIENPDNWPRWPILPMKNPDGQLGFLYNGSLYNNTPIFYVGNIFEPKKAVEQNMTVYQILADGWRVD